MLENPCTLNLFENLSNSLLEMKNENVNLTDDNGSTDLNVSPMLHGHSADRSAFDSQSVSTRTVSSSSEKNIIGEKAPSKKRRKVDSLVQGGYMKVSQNPNIDTIDLGGASGKKEVMLSTAAEKPSCPSSSSSSAAAITVTAVAATEVWWQCKSCDRRFKSEQGIKTHVYMMHVLGAADAVSEDILPSASTLKCDICGKMSSNKEAFEQHTIAKHSGLFRSVKPAWAVGQIPAEEDLLHTNIELQFECEICGINFLSLDLLRSHLEGWQPVTPTDQLSCLKCFKIFRDDRALKQHMNNCYKSN